MMSASEGGGGLWKSRHSKGGCILEYKSVPNADKGGGGQKAEHFSDVINGCSLMLGCCLLNRHRMNEWLHTV